MFVSGANMAIRSTAVAAAILAALGVSAGMAKDKAPTGGECLDVARVP
jgi:hypothetical protein